jgi:hypothetical protein
VALGLGNRITQSKYKRNKMKAGTYGRGRGRDEGTGTVILGDRDWAQDRQEDIENLLGGSGQTVILEDQEF